MFTEATFKSWMLSVKVEIRWQTCEIFGPSGAHEQIGTVTQDFVKY